MPANRKIKVAVAGIGFIGPVHIEALRRLPGIEVAAICHSNEKTAREKATSLFVPHSYSDFGKMIREIELDCIHICTPNDLHYSMVKTALTAGKHVVCDKPLAMTVTEAEELLQLASAKNLVHAVNFNIRYYPLVREIKCMREKGELGDVCAVMGSYLQDWLFYNTDYNWRVDPAKSGDSKAIADIGSHLIDLIEYTTGLQVTEVMADFSTIHCIRKKPLKNVDTYTNKLLDSGDCIDVPVNLEDHATVLLRFNNGRKGVAVVSQVAAGRKNRVSIELSGSKCSVTWCSEQPNDLQIGRRDEPNQVVIRDPGLVDERTRAIISYPGGHNEGFGDTSKQLFKEIYADIRSGQPSPDPSYPTFKHGLRELKICERIVQSDKLERWVKV